jgi:hypothetical protein
MPRKIRKEYYPYILVCRPSDKKLYRHFKYEPIPKGFFKVIFYRSAYGSKYTKYREYPNDPITGELKTKYWTLPRTSDVLDEERLRTLLEKANLESQPSKTS